MAYCFYCEKPVNELYRTRPYTGDGYVSKEACRKCRDKFIDYAHEEAIKRNEKLA
ncbi:MAG: hypothetical protein ACLFUH_04600 [Bacteroidales bacterium]